MVRIRVCSGSWIKGWIRHWITDGLVCVHRVGDGLDSEEDGRTLVERLAEPADWLVLCD